MEIINQFYPRVIPVGETAFTVEFCNSINVDCNAHVHALDKYLQTHQSEGVIETVPTYRSLLVIYNPSAVKPDKLRMNLQTFAERILDTRSASFDSDEKNLHTAVKEHIIEIPVVYGDESGPDLLDVAAHTNLKPEEVIQKHTNPVYQVAMLGFAPGFCYLLGLPAALNTPRLATPRMHVPPGSVGIAGNQTGIYALETPGGWRIIGRTHLNLFDPAREEPFVLHAGDQVRFISIHR